MCNQNKFKCKHIKCDLDGCYCGIKMGGEYNHCAIPYYKAECEYFEEKQLNVRKQDSNFTFTDLLNLEMEDLMKNQLSKLEDTLPTPEALKCLISDTDVVKYFYDKGLRVLDENSVIISKDEYEGLKQEADQSDPFWFCSFGGCEGVCKECKDTCEKSIFVQARKQGITDVLNELYMYFSAKTLLGLPNKYKDDSYARLIERYAKQFDIEIKKDF